MADSGLQIYDHLLIIQRDKAHLFIQGNRLFVIRLHIEADSFYLAGIMFFYKAEQLLGQANTSVFGADIDLIHPQHPAAGLLGKGMSQQRI